MSRRLLPLVVAMMAAVPLVATAQSSTQPVYKANASDQPCMMHDMMMGPMMGMMGGSMADHQKMAAMKMNMRKMTDASVMQDMRKQLNLTDAQVKQMQDIHQRACAAAAPHMKLAMDAHMAAMQALASDNLDAFKTQASAAAEHMVAAQVEFAKGMIEFHKSLTPEQRQKMDAMHQKMTRGT